MRKYLEVLDLYLKEQFPRFLSRLSREDLTHAERALLIVRRLIRKRRFKMAEEIALGLSTDHDPLLNGEKHFFLGNLASYRSEWERSAIHNQVALESYGTAGLQRGLFRASYNLSVDYSRLNLVALSFHYLQKAQGFAVTPLEKCGVLRALACHYAAECDYEKVVVHVERALQLFPELNAFEGATLKLVAADLLFRSGLELESLAMLEELKRSQSIRDRARLHFDHTMVRFIVRDAEGGVDGALAAIGEAPDVVQENTEYFLKWKILSCLVGGERTRVLDFWARLHELQPAKYKSEFPACAPSERRSIFIQALERVRQAQSRETPLRLGDERDGHSLVAREAILPDLRASLSGKCRTLFDLLSKSDMPLCKEELIERIWGVPYDPSFDARFYKLVERLKKININVVNQNRAYRIVS